MATLRDVALSFSRHLLLRLISSSQNLALKKLLTTQSMPPTKRLILAGIEIGQKEDGGQ